MESSTRTLLPMMLAGCVGRSVPRLAVVVIGQDNAGNHAAVNDLSDPSWANPYPSVLLDATLGDGVEVVAYPTGPLRPIDSRLGIELSLGRTLDAAEPGRWEIVKYAIDGSSLNSDWYPYNAKADLFASQLAAIQASNAVPVAAIWIQGEADAGPPQSTEPLSAARYYGGMLSELISAERSALHSDIPFFVGRLNVRYGGENTDLVRLGEEQNVATDVIVFDQDPYPLQPDNIHYTADGCVALGEAYAAMILSTINRR